MRRVRGEEEEDTGVLADAVTTAAEAGEATGEQEDSLIGIPAATRGKHSTVFYTLLCWKYCSENNLIL